MKREDLLKLIEDDDLGLLKPSSKKSAAATADERLISAFHQINQFVASHGREPASGKGIQEHQLYARLKGVRESQEKIRALMDLDEHNLLQKEAREVKSIQDVFEDDDLGILESDGESIFTLKHVKAVERSSSEYVAKRKRCSNFEEYAPLFERVHAELKSGKRKLVKFHDKDENLQEGSFYVLSGVLVYLEKVTITSPEKTIKGKRFRKDGRTRCIFENGLESDMLYRSLSKALLQDGRLITEHEDHLLDGFSSITKDDKDTGFIYVLKSLSDRPEVQSIEHLYKIGFSKVPVEERIKSASQEPTYLMAPVQIVSAYRCFNMNPQKMELLLHTFFGSACLNIDVFDNNGRRHTPREWFVAPLDVIEQAIQLMMSGEIVGYKYDPTRQEITPRG